jgi:hypothetical protein
MLSVGFLVLVVQRFVEMRQFEQELTEITECVHWIDSKVSAAAIKTECS